MVRHSWRTHLKAATDERAIVALVATYLGEWKPAEVESLPEGAWPTRLSTSGAVIEHSVKLAQLHAAFEGCGPGLAYLQEMLLFFTHAAVAATRLAAARDPQHCPPAPRRTGARSRKALVARR